MHALDRGGESIEKLALRFQTNDPIGARAQHQRRDVDRARVREQTLRGVVQIQQNVDRDLAENERIGVVARGLHGIVREHLRFHVALHIAGPDGFLF